MQSSEFTIPGVMVCPKFTLSDTADCSMSTQTTAINVYRAESAITLTSNIPNPSVDWQALIKVLVS